MTITMVMHMTIITRGHPLNFFEVRAQPVDDFVYALGAKEFLLKLGDVVVFLFDGVNVKGLNLDILEVLELPKRGE